MCGYRSQLMVPLLIAFVGSLAGCSRNSPGGADPEEVKTLRSKVDELAKRVEHLETRIAATKTSGGVSLPLPQATGKGRATFSDGKKRQFASLAGVRRGDGDRGAGGVTEPGTLVLYQNAIVHQFPISDLAKIEVGDWKKDPPMPGKLSDYIPVTIRTKDNKVQTVNVVFPYDTKVDIRWEGEVSTLRIPLDLLQAAVFEFE